MRTELNAKVGSSQKPSIDRFISPVAREMNRVSSINTGSLFGEPLLNVRCCTSHEVEVGVDTHPPEFTDRGNARVRPFLIRNISKRHDHSSIVNDAKTVSVLSG